MLHLIFQSPVTDAVLERINTNDVVVFLDNAVLQLMQNNCLFSIELLKTQHCYVLADSLAVRGLQLTELIPVIQSINYQQLVSLTVQNTPIQSWT